MTQIRKDKITAALLAELDRQTGAAPGASALKAYLVQRPLDVAALADAVAAVMPAETAGLAGGYDRDDGKAPEELNSANDG